MSPISSADHQPNDRFGFSCYALVIPASLAVTERCNAIERESGMTRAKIPAHITVKGTFHSIESLDEVIGRAEIVTRHSRCFFISFEGAQSYWWEDGGYLAVPILPALQKLHDDLVAAIAPLGAAAYQDDPYRAHMTYIQGVSPEGLARAKVMVAESDFGDGFMATVVNLMGRNGPAKGGAWRCIRSFPLEADPT